jgi:hypothetical protein
MNGAMACDTDSLLIVSSREDGLYRCRGGTERLPDGREAVRALSHAGVDAILARLDDLNPYDRDVVPSLIKVEPENVGPDDPPDQELYGYAISAKRYALYRQSPLGRRIVKASAHGLGMYRRPYEDPPGWDKPWPAWVEDAWEAIIDGDEQACDADPRLAAPAVSQLTVSSPHLLAPFRHSNAGRPYADRVKPFSFMLVGHVDPLVPMPDGIDGKGLVPVAPFASTGAAALSPPWRNRRDGRPVRVTTDHRPGSGAIRLKTYADVLADYRRHPEHKSGDPAGGPGVRTSEGLLPRLHLQVACVPVHIGKESNQLEEEESGAIVDPDEATVEYRDERAEWEAVVPALRRLRDEKGWRYLAEASGMSERAVRYTLNEGKVPHQEARRRLRGLVATPQG